jgi:carboxymethylenebutenolidase
MIEQTVDVPVPSGATRTFIVHPEREGPHPVAVMFMDAPGVREPLRDMARRLASVGYYVMLPNLYHRQGRLDLSDIAALPEDETRERVRELVASLTVPDVMEDCDALLGFADSDPAASPGRAGCVAYGMSGQFAVNLAARHPERIRAASVICGVKLVTDQDESPHLALERASAEFYFACAGEDSWAPMAVVEALDQAAKSYGPQTEVEVFPGLRHGFAVPGRPVYDKLGSERCWERTLALFRRRLQIPEPMGSL